MKPKASVFPSFVTNGSIGIFDSRIVRTVLSKITQTVENSWRSDIERRFMVMDSADCYQGIIYHANTVEFQCTYPPSIVSDQGVHFVSLHFVSLHFVSMDFTSQRMRFLGNGQRFISINPEGRANQIFSQRLRNIVPNSPVYL